jgi:hypothetical protein
MCTPSWTTSIPNSVYYCLKISNSLCVLHLELPVYRICVCTNYLKLSQILYVCFCLGLHLTLCVGSRSSLKFNINFSKHSQTTLNNRTVPSYFVSRMNLPYNRHASSFHASQVQSFVPSLQPLLLTAAFVILLVVSHHLYINHTGEARLLLCPFLKAT